MSLGGSRAGAAIRDWILGEEEAGVCFAIMIVHATQMAQII